MNTENSRTVQGYKRHQKPRLLFNQIKRKYRETWIRIRVKHSNLLRKELVKIGGHIYKWLRRNDSEWLEKHLPKSQKIGSPREKLDWKMIDVEIYKKVEKVCKEIKDIKESPTRITISEIKRRIGNKVWLDKRHEKLPLTKKLIDENLESREYFMLRKVKWTKEFYIKSNKIPTLSQFKTKACLKNLTFINSIKVQKAAQDALNEIKINLL